MAKVRYSHIMKLFFLVSICLLVISSCKKIEAPKNLIPKEKMSFILSDVHMAENSLQTFDGTDRDSLAILFYSQIFRIHEVEEAHYYKSMEYYTHSPEDLKEIYENTEELLKSRGAEVSPKK